MVGEALRDYAGLEARVLNGTTTKADVEWLVDSLETVKAELDDLRESAEAVQRTITKIEEWALVQRMVGALVGKYGASLSEETEEQARLLVFVTLAGLGIEVA
jgi:hypothetical protein